MMTDALGLKDAQTSSARSVGLSERQWAQNLLQDEDCRIPKIESLRACPIMHD